MRGRPRHQAKGDGNPRKPLDLMSRAGDLFLEFGKLLLPHRHPPHSRVSACTKSAGQRQVGQGGQEDMHSGWGLKGFPPRKPPSEHVPTPNPARDRPGEGTEARLVSPRDTSSHSPRAPHTHVTTDPPDHTVHGPILAHIQAQGHTQDTGTHAGATES